MQAMELPGEVAKSRREDLPNYSVLRLNPDYDEEVNSNSPKQGFRR